MRRGKIEDPGSRRIRAIIKIHALQESLDVLSLLIKEMLERSENGIHTPF